MKRAINILTGGILLLAILAAVATTTGCDDRGNHMSYRRGYCPPPRGHRYPRHNYHRSRGYGRHYVARPRYHGYHRSRRHWDEDDWEDYIDDIEDWVDDRYDD